MGIFKQNENMDQKAKKPEKKADKKKVFTTKVYREGKLVEETTVERAAQPKATVNQTAKPAKMQQGTAEIKQEPKGFMRAVKDFVQGPKELPKEPSKEPAKETQKAKASTVQTTKGITGIEGTVDALETTLKSGTLKSGTITPYYSRSFIPYKPIEEKKLTILLIENTLQVAAQKQDVEKIVDGLVREGLVRIIYYGKDIQETGTFKAEDIRYKELLLEDKIGEEACLYDALLMASSLADKSYMVIEESEKEKIRINCIEILGIGTCRDQGSKCTQSIAAQKFSDIAKKFGIITKYFCLTEESFIAAAEMGFRSIGSIAKTY